MWCTSPPSAACRASLGLHRGDFPPSQADARRSSARPSAMAGVRARAGRGGGGCSTSSSARSERSPRSMIPRVRRRPPTCRSAGRWNGCGACITSVETSLLDALDRRDLDTARETIAAWQSDEGAHAGHQPTDARGARGLSHAPRQSGRACAPCSTSYGSRGDSRRASPRAPVPSRSGRRDRPAAADAGVRPASPAEGRSGSCRRPSAG